MKQWNKIIKISLILLLSCFIMVNSYGAETTNVGNLQSINAQIKQYLQRNGCPIDNYQTSTYQFTSVGTKTIAWNTNDNKFTVEIQVVNRGTNQYQAMFNTIVESKNNPSAPPLSIEQWQETQNTGSSSGHTAGEIIDESKNFVEIGENAVSPGISPENLQKLSNTIYNILLVVGIALAVVIAAILGIKFITGGIEAQVDVKKALVPYIAGCVVIFGAFIIWKIVLQVLNSI